MLLQSAIGLLLLANASLSPADTVLDVRQGDRLVIRDFRGTVVVDSWDRSQLRASLDTKESRRFLIRRSGSELELGLEERAHRERREDLRLTLPTWISLELSGNEVEVEVEGIHGNVEIRNLRGDLTFADMGGVVEARSVEGRIEARDLTGTARLRTGEDDIRVSSSTASLNLETVDGDIRLEDVGGRHISARSTDGDITFTGGILPGGNYGFFSHDGDITLRIEPPADFDASILSYGGRFESEFPVRAAGFRSGESLDFSVGSGGARVVVETFSGPVLLMRAPGHE
ncbi:MAG: DUF4097 family beta strand repeat-containing protein [Gemmatimonadota bacterium]|jgi:hypothetical protein